MPNHPKNSSQAAHNSSFLENFDAHLTNISSNHPDAIILLDSNLNLLPATLSPLAADYLASIHNNGFIQCIHKATRIQGATISLIDHILTNPLTHNIISGSLISDISDHYFTFICLPIHNNKPKPEPKPDRDFSLANLERLKAALTSQNWQETLALQDVDPSFDSFWTIFKQLFDICIPLTTKKFNKNCHKISDFMTQGLLNSRKTKLSLQKT